MITSCYIHYSHCLDDGSEQKTCGPNEFQCPSGAPCIRMSETCDYTNHCGDHADELLASCPRKIIFMLSFLLFLSFSLSLSISLITHYRGYCNKRRHPCTRRTFNTPPRQIWVLRYIIPWLFTEHSLSFNKGVDLYYVHPHEACSLVETYIIQV